MKLNKERFLRTELGSSLEECIIAWDWALDECRQNEYYTDEYKAARETADRCQAQWEVYKMAIRQFYGVEYCFTRTDKYYGLVKERSAGEVERKKYKRLRYEDRQEMEKMLKAGDSVAAIAAVLGVHKDTIYKELTRCGADRQTYTAAVAQATL